MNTKKLLKNLSQKIKIGSLLAEKYLDISKSAEKALELDEKIHFLTWIEKEELKHDCAYFRGRAISYKSFIIYLNNLSCDIVMEDIR